MTLARAVVVLSCVVCACRTVETPAVATDRRAAPLDAGAVLSPAFARLPLWPQVVHGTLPNGLQYYVLKHGKPEKRAHLWLAVNAGSVAEDEDQRGLAHFVEHMAFNGTAKYPKAQIIDALEKMGMRFGADVNAYTTYDETVYQIEVPTDVAGPLDTGLDILHQWAGSISFDATEVDQERGVVLSESRVSKGVAQRVGDKQRDVELGGTRYGSRKPIGSDAILRAAPKEALQRFYKDWYQPSLMAVIIVGDVDVAAAEAKVRQVFGDFKDPAEPRERPAGGVPKADGTRVSIEADAELTSTAVQVINLVAHRPEATLDDVRRIFIERLYTMIFNERMALLSRRADAPFSAAGSSVSEVTREIDALTRGASVKGGKVEASLNRLIGETLRAEKFGFTQSELDRARAVMARSYLQSDLEAATTDSAMWAREITRNFFEGEFMVGTAEEKRQAMEILPTLSLAELNLTASRFGGGDNRVILISGPNAKALPSRERVLTIVKEAESDSLEAWQDKAGPGALMTEAPKPGSIVKEVLNPKIGTVEWTLSNGIHVVFKPTEFALDSVSLAGLSPGGLAMASDAQLNDARFANDFVTVGGAGALDAEALSKALAGKHVSVQTSIGETTESVSGTASVSDLEPLFQLVHLRLTRPRRDDEVIATARANSVERFTELQRSPQFQYAVGFQEALTMGNRRTKPPTAQDIARIDVSKAFAFFNDRFGDASDFTFSIVGATSAEVLKPLIEKYLASLPAKGRLEKERDVGVRFVKGVVKKKFALEQEAKSAVTLMLHGDDRWSLEKNRDMFILSEVVSMRLRERLREELGGVYSVAARGSLSRTGHQRRVFTVSFTAAPEKADELLKAAFDEMAAIAKHGIGEAYLEKVKVGFERERETELRTNGFWLGHLLTSAYFHDDPSIVLDLTNITKRITSANVQAAAKRFLDPSQYFEAELTPAPAVTK